VRDAARLTAVVAAALLVAASFVRLRDSKGYGLRPGQPAPSFRLPSLSAGEVDLASFRGRWVLINFWATWCSPCVEEMASIERLHRSLGPEGLVVLGVSVDDDDDAPRRFAERSGLTFQVLRDRGGRVATEAYRTTGYPETFLVDRSGTLAEKVIGPRDWAAPEVVEELRGLLRGLVPVQVP
jgi:cytochrome c biogenesis protein CcmG/thiol:disulfide interchange protein DsbE